MYIDEQEEEEEEEEEESKIKARNQALTWFAMAEWSSYSFSFVAADPRDER
jgi:hypothetical protein